MPAEDRGGKKTPAYREAWTWACDQYKINQEKKGRSEQFFGAKKIAKAAKNKFGAGPSARKIETAFRSGQTSPGKPGAPAQMPADVGDTLHEVTTLLRAHSLAVYPSLIIENAKLLITGREAEEDFAKTMNTAEDTVLEWDEDKLRRWYQRHFLATAKLATNPTRGCHFGI